MDDLIKALQIFRKYGNSRYPTNCSHDVLYVDIDQSLVSPSDIVELEQLGFRIDDCGFSSFRFGSC